MKQAVIAIFASGAGSNAQKIMEHFKEHPFIKVGLLCSNKDTSGALDLAKKEGLPTLCFTRDVFYHSTTITNQLQKQGITHIVLAGFLWLIPQELIKEYNNRIINIHPSLLPRFGGKGMYGKHVHAAVKQAGENETGITIHLVNEQYDKGEILLQKKTILTGAESVEEIASKVHSLEHQFFSETIEKWIVNSTQAS